MRTPPILKKGDTVAIAATARKINPEEWQNAVNLLSSWELEVVFSENIAKSDHQFAGNDKERRIGFQQLIDDDNIKAIICARGGYGTVRIIDDLDFSHFSQNPKWIVGYSDITVLHSHIHRHFAIETLHSCMPYDFSAANPSPETIESCRSVLFGQPLNYELQVHPLSRIGACEGILCGGNLSILYSLTGTASDIDTTNKILFLEDVDEYLYHIDRMMLSLKRSGKLNCLKGLIIGSFSKMNDNAVPFGKNAEEIIVEAVSEYNYPVLFGFPAGHCNDNRALVLGRNVKFDIQAAKATLCC
ncbi:MAG: LD-carboxypeptidase [Lentimicrobiaceae bacterium]|nr:LD-carboxypeptidase [Lentimicrobiaceae bacterium]